MLVRPGGVAARCVHNAEDRVGANEIPGEDRRATVCRIARELVGIDGGATAVHARWRAAVEQVLVEVDTLVEFGSGARGRSEGGAKTGRSRDSVPGGRRRWIER